MEVNFNNNRIISEKNLNFCFFLLFSTPNRTLIYKTSSPYNSTHHQNFDCHRRLCAVEQLSFSNILDGSNWFLCTVCPCAFFFFFFFFVVNWWFSVALIKYFSFRFQILLLLLFSVINLPVVSNKHLQRQTSKRKTICHQRLMIDKLTSLC